MEVSTMIYPYMTLPDETEIVFTNVFEEDGVKKVEVHFERPTDDGLDTARCQLPSYTWLIREGFSEEEISFFEQFLRDNTSIFYKYSSYVNTYNGDINCGEKTPFIYNPQ